MMIKASVLLAMLLALVKPIDLNVISEKKAANKVLLVSFDGLRADKFDEFIHHYPDSNFKKLVNEGVHAEYMIPVFPSLTFPSK
jgi:predicted AlkP superfamily pyrophosphatase or phosphodiesterase